MFCFNVTVLRTTIAKWNSTNKHTDDTNNFFNFPKSGEKKDRQNAQNSWKNVSCCDFLDYCNEASIFTEVI
jgi:hypothetical protein